MGIWGLQPLIENKLKAYMPYNADTSQSVKLNYTLAFLLSPWGYGELRGRTKEQDIKTLLHIGALDNAGR